MYTFTELSPTKVRFQATTASGTTILNLDGAASAIHGQIIAMITSDESKKDRLGQLLEWDANFAFTLFCLENSFIIPPDEVVEEPVV